MHSGNPTTTPRPCGWRMRAARILLTAAMLAAAYLAWVTSQGSAVAGCGQTADCVDVLRSKVSHWLGLLVSVPAK